MVDFLFGGSPPKFIRWCRNNVNVEQFIMFVKFELNDEKGTLLIRGYDMYVGGFMLEDVNCLLPKGCLSMCEVYDRTWSPDQGGLILLLQYLY